MATKRRSWFRTGAFWVWWMAMSVLVLAVTCKEDVQGPTIIEPEDDTTESDTTENQGFLGPAYVKDALV